MSIKVSDLQICWTCFATNEEPAADTKLVQLCVGGKVASYCPKHAAPLLALNQDSKLREYQEQVLECT